MKDRHIRCNVLKEEKTEKGRKKRHGITPFILQIESADGRGPGEGSCPGASSLLGFWGWETTPEKMNVPPEAAQPESDGGLTSNAALFSV